jgi:hypothetical protein
MHCTHPYYLQHFHHHTETVITQNLVWRSIAKLCKFDSSLLPLYEYKNCATASFYLLKHLSDSDHVSGLLGLDFCNVGEDPLCGTFIIFMHLQKHSWRTK